MNEEDKVRQQIAKYIDKDKWWDKLSQFINVLRINIFMVDVNGGIVLPPEEFRYGGRLLIDSSLKFDLLKSKGSILDQFDMQGDYYESINRYELHSFALPIKSNSGEAVAYLIIGPVILNARLETDHYRGLARQYDVSAEEILDEILQIRVISHVMIRSILNLFREMIRDHVSHKVTQKELEKIKSAVQNMSDSFNNVAEEIYATVRKDELLATLLDVAMNMTQSECGSIMLLDDKRELLSVKASRGLDKNRIQSVQRVGDGVAGWVAEQNEAVFIAGNIEEQNNRISKWLKRPDIKEAAIVPLVVDDKVLGVLNLHSKKVRGKLKSNISNLQHLSGLLSSVL